MLCAALVKNGGLNRGAAASIWPMFSLELNPETKAALEATAADWAFPGTPGASTPEDTNVFFNGGLVSKEVSIVPGKMSKKIPPPPRMTVLPTPKGCQAKPIRGSQLTAW